VHQLLAQDLDITWDVTFGIAYTHLTPSYVFSPFPLFKDCDFYPHHSSRKLFKSTINPKVHDTASRLLSNKAKDH
ncbi:MAG TPA: hypothetical protein VJ044_19295, partial [Candidatus Hodarchaeales archaeon]|nr:hypothetical protein [Candidatus Hodarchaeales archaeon]